MNSFQGASSFRKLLFLLLVLPVTALSSKTLWSSTPANYKSIISEAYPLGNGKLAALPFGSAGQEKVNLNVDSLWTGGPFASSAYIGGNPTAAVYSKLPGIREYIFEKGTGNFSGLQGDASNYGSFQVLGNLSVALDGVTSTTAYRRSLSLNNGVHTTTYTANDKNTYTSTVYCSYPDQVCIYNLSSSAALPKITIGLENLLLNSTLATSSCGSNFVRLTGLTQVGPPTGMKFDSIGRLTSTATTSCSGSSLVIPASSKIKTFSIAVSAGTNYDQTKGNSANSFSFKGADPAAYVVATSNAAAAKSEGTVRAAHIADYQSLAGIFTLTLPDTSSSAGLETADAISRYSWTGPGDPYVESLLLELGRHLYISSTRDNSLPANLAGKWSQQLKASWGADYHANINLQMNNWGADQLGLGDLQVSLWNYIQDTWVPRGTETAHLVYNAPGWVTHDEMNIFGHTGMKSGSAGWANYPASAAWMMQHVFDHFDYSQDTTWLKSQGYPLLKGVAQFWQSQIMKDLYFKDGSLVVNNCNSPEHGPTTFACTHYQQLLHQVFEGILSTSTLAGETDTAFVKNITTSLSTLDKGLHIGTWGEVKEWKIPDSFGYDFENDTHRHLSNLVGWYPGFALSSFQEGYTNKTIQNAVATTLYSRGLGNASDANAGWEKVWRSACWARLNNTAMAYKELKYAIDVNFADNGFSMYSALRTPFQIDANFGLVGAVLAMLIVDLPQLSSDSRTHQVVLGPSIGWPAGEVTGLQLRGGGSVNFAWDATGLVTSANFTGRTQPIVAVNKQGKVLAKQ